MNTRLLIAFIILIGCKTSQPIQSTPPIISPIHDTIIQLDTINRVTAIVNDTTVTILLIAPSLTGDSYSVLQAAINYVQTHHPLRILLTGYRYAISKPLIVYKLNATGTDYAQSSVWIEGLQDGKNCPAGFTAMIAPTFANASAIYIQQGKSVYIGKLQISGRYFKSQSFSLAQIDTTTFKNYGDGVCTDGSTNAEAAINIDAFSDSTLYDGVQHKMYEGLHSFYLPNMHRYGSTDVHIDGVGITNFIVGIGMSMSYQLNAEEINIENCNISYCRSAIVFCQAQSKKNIVRNIMCWGGTHTFLDGANYGFRHGDGATCPIVEFVNIAGGVYQLINVGSAFPVSISHVYAELLFKIGVVNSGAGITFFDLQVDFQSSEGNTPSPDFYYYGLGTTWIGCMLRQYGTGTKRLVLNNWDNYFYGGSIGSVPYITATDAPPNGWEAQPAAFQNVTVFYDKKNLNTYTYEFKDIPLGNIVVHINPDFTGWYLRNDTAGAIGGDLLLYDGKPSYDQYPQFNCTSCTLGYVTHYTQGLAKDTVWFENAGLGLHDDTLHARISTYRLNTIPFIASSPDFMLGSPFHWINDTIIPTKHTTLKFKSKK